jgi:hypothetical protein
MRRTSLALFAFLLLAPVLRADNYVRSVRVSWIEGDVQVQRATDTAQPAIPNMPIIEGMTFTTGSDGVLEIELEDGSTVRLTPDSALRIPELVTSDQGAHRSTFELQSGTAYIDFKHHGDDEVYFRFPGHDIRLNRSVRLRAEVAASEAQVAVFDGEFEVRGPDESVKVKKDETISLGLADDSTFVLTKNIAPAPYDDWNHQLQQTADQYTSSSNNNGNFWSRLFGTGYNGGNLNYYGQTYYEPAYGWVWQPYYLTGAPCTTGYWQWYPGWGWTFISSSPWGWGTCNYGAWNFVPVRGWVWCPPRHHHHHLWANWSPTPRWGTVPPGFVGPRKPLADGHAGPMKIIAEGNVPPNPRQLDRDDRDPRRSIHAPFANNNLAGRGRSTSSDSTAAGSGFVKSDTGVTPGAAFTLNGGPRSVNELRRELGANDGAPAMPLHIVKQGVLHRGAPPVSILQSSPGKTISTGRTVTTTTDVRRGNDNDGHFHNQLGTTTAVTTPRNDSHSSQPQKARSNSGWGWHPNNSSSSSNNSSANRSNSSNSGSSHHSGGGGSSYHPSGGGGGGSHPSGGGGGGGSHPSSGGGGSGGSHSGGSSSSSSSSSGSHSGKH